MYYLRRNKSELIVLTGAVYSFVAYLTAFALEILFLIDLTRRANELLASSAGRPLASSDGLSGASIGASPAPLPSAPAPPTAGAAAASETSEISETSEANESSSQEALQAQITLACLTIAILYFVVFITSLMVIVALILRSTFMLLTWQCAMASLYLPELALVVYVSVYSWGLGTRNGQTELGFYLFRAALNPVFVLRAHRLYKQWKQEKDFFALSKARSASNFSSALLSPYNHSPYFIGGSLTRYGHTRAGPDSLTTTINPIFSTSTLNLSHYDFVRDQFDQQQQQQRQTLPSSSSLSSAYSRNGASPATQDGAAHPVSAPQAASNQYHNHHHHHHQQQRHHPRRQYDRHENAQPAAYGGGRRRPASALYASELNGTFLEGTPGARKGRDNSTHQLNDPAGAGPIRFSGHEFGGTGQAFKNNDNDRTNDNLRFVKENQRFYLGELSLSPPASPRRPAPSYSAHLQSEQPWTRTRTRTSRASASINDDDFDRESCAEYQLDLDYRTLGKSHDQLVGADR